MPSPTLYSAELFILNPKSITAFCKRNGSHADFCWIRKFNEIHEPAALVDGRHISDEFWASENNVDIFPDVVAMIWHQFLSIYPILHTKPWYFKQGNKLKMHLIIRRMQRSHSMTDCMVKCTTYMSEMIDQITLIPASPLTKYHTMSLAPVNTSPSPTIHHLLEQDVIQGEQNTLPSRIVWSVGGLGD